MTDPMGSGPVRTSSLRAHNLGLVLRQVARGADPVSRTELAAATGLTKVSVSRLVDELIAGSLLVESAPRPRSGAGRPALGLGLSTSGPAGLGLEVNVDYLAALVIDLTGSVRQHAVQHGDQRGRSPAAVLASLSTLARDAVAAAAAVNLTVAGTAVAVPGLITDGIVRLAPNLGWHDIDVRAALGIDITVENEANLAALAELHASGHTNFLYISGEIGVGAGIVLGGQLVLGGRGFAGELGHVAIRPDGPPCHCGARGCLETYASSETLLRTAGVASLDSLTVAARAGSPPALAALAAAGSALGVAAAGAVNLLDLDTVVLGGVYAPLIEWLGPAVAQELATRALPSRWSRIAVRGSALGDNAAVVGAAGSVIRRLLDSPADWLALPRA